mmetsp:Transcript_95736/g.194630  ORF Transcript_95736/g.194630 Transcript_95736/m.194630 type:complete len:239 (+) Transcript_95736:95-811(+)
MPLRRCCRSARMHLEAELVDHSQPEWGFAQLREALVQAAQDLLAPGRAPEQACKLLHHEAAVASARNLDKRGRAFRLQQRSHDGPLLILTSEVERPLHHVACSPVHRELGHEAVQLPQDLCAPMWHAVLEEMLDHEVPVGVPADRLGIRDDLIHKASNLGLGAVLDEALEHTATEAVPGHHSRPLLDKPSDQGPQRGRWHHLDDLRQHVVPVERFVELHGMRLKRRDELIPARTSRHL